MDNNEKTPHLDLHGIPEDIKQSLEQYLEQIRNPSEVDSITPKYGVLSLLAKNIPKGQTANENDTLTISIKLNDEGETVSMKVPKAEFEREMARSELLHMMIPVQGHFKKLTADDIGSSISDIRKNALSGNDNDHSSTPKNK